MLNLAQIRHLMASPFGYAPLVTITGSPGEWTFPFAWHFGTPYSLNHRVIEICATEKQARQLLEFRLKPPRANCLGTTQSISLARVLACLTDIPIALPARRANTLRQVLQFIGVASYASPYVGTWETTPLGKIRFQIVRLADSNDRPKIIRMARSLASPKNRTRKTSRRWQR